MTSHRSSPIRRSARAALAGGCAITLAATGFLVADTASASSDSFSATGSMATPRIWATAERASNGKVLIAGGQNASNAVLNSTSLYDPTTGTFSAGPTMSTARSGAISAPLSNGMILVGGGFLGPGAGTMADSTQLYNPATNSFIASGDVAVQTSQPTTVTLADGRVLATGGSNGGVVISNGSQTFSLASGPNGAWTTRGNMTAARMLHTATRLANGDVLVAGGQANSTTYSSAEIFSASSNTFAATNPMAVARYGAAATLLPNGKVLIVGGRGSTGTFLNGSEVYDPTSGTFSFGPSMEAEDARAYATATTLADGRILIAGGEGSSGYVSTTEIYNPLTDTFSDGPDLTAPRSNATATRLSNGQVLIAGGYGMGAAILSSADLFTPGVTPPPSPQVLVGCSALPKKIKKTGNTVVLKKRCYTTAGQPLHVTVKRVGKKKGTHKVVRTSAGKVTIRTKNARGLKLKVTRGASATTGYYAYSQAKTYKIK